MQIDKVLFPVLHHFILNNFSTLFFNSIYSIEGSALTKTVYDFHLKLIDYMPLSHCQLLATTQKIFLHDSIKIT